MRLSVSIGDNTVHISMKGSSSKQLLTAEGVASRLLQTTPPPQPKATAFGFGATSDHDVAGTSAEADEQRGTAP